MKKSIETARQDPVPVRRCSKSPVNRSLERGVDILRAFRPGSDLLGNGELAERTGLARATVSRLTQTLVGTGFLQYDTAQRGYRLGAPVLSLAHAMHAASPVLQVAAPWMRAVAMDLRINVSLAVPDRDEMVYLESVRYNRKATLRSVVTGQRVPIELTSLGHAWLAVAPADQRCALLAAFAERRGAQWPALRGQIDQAIDSVHSQGWCAASWQPEVVALAAPLVCAQHPVHVLNMSVSSPASVDAVVRQLREPLRALAARIVDALQ